MIFPFQFPSASRPIRSNFDGYLPFFCPPCWQRTTDNRRCGCVARLDFVIPRNGGFCHVTQNFLFNSEACLLSALHVNLDFVFFSMDQCIWCRPGILERTCAWVTTVTESDAVSRGAAASPPSQKRTSHFKRVCHARLHCVVKLHSRVSLLNMRFPAASAINVRSPSTTVRKFGVMVQRD